MISNIGYGTYFVFAAFTTLSIPFVYFFLPETKGLSLEEIDVLFDGPTGAMDDVILEEAKIGEEKAAHIERSQA